MSESTSQELRLVTVANYLERVEANLALDLLESAGIAATLRGESANSVAPLTFTAQLQVRAEDEADAREILESVEDSPASLESVTAAEQEDEAIHSLTTAHS
jgi:hypothetical protein